MRFILQNLNIALFFYFLTLNIIFIYCVVFRFKKNRKIILCYHSIDKSGWRFSTSSNDFEKQIIYLKKNFDIVPLEEILKNNESAKPQASLTFDDGYQSVVMNALPIMERYKVKGTVFVIGNTKNRDKKVLNNNKPLLNKTQIDKLKKAGWTIGYHTKTHTTLKKLRGKRLSSEIRSKFKYLAYPNGFYNEKVIKEVKKSGYENAFTIDGGNVNFSNKYLINRIPMEGKISLNQFKSLLSPVGISFSKIFMDLLKFKEYTLKPLFTK